MPRLKVDISSVPDKLPEFVPQYLQTSYGEGEIQEKVATFRMMLLEKDVAVVKEGEQQQKPT